MITLFKFLGVIAIVWFQVKATVALNMSERQNSNCEVNKESFILNGFCACCVVYFAILGISLM